MLIKMTFRSFSSKGMSMYNKANKATLSELNKQHEIVKLLSTSLNRAHAKAEDVSKKLGLNLKSDTLVDGRYTHKEYVDAHLELMMFLLKAELITEFFGIYTRTGSASQQPTYELISLTIGLVKLGSHKK